MPAVTNFVMEATSMIKGISREKPAEERLRCMEYIWSAYEVMGEVTRLTVLVS